MNSCGCRQHTAEVARVRSRLILAELSVGVTCDPSLPDVTTCRNATCQTAKFLANSLMSPVKGIHNYDIIFYACRLGKYLLPS